ncbi:MULTISPECIES: hypothetical protein [unclassified Endozoicomonas]|uniref:hypothetical protein n=1 Tax=unclassified Endozoicomonas TaxID=2644528 RepID=UPI0021489BD3|nr:MULTISPECIES: hypothetical protein [unclassified Endozoicomonas]
MLLSNVCQTELLTGSFIVELDQNADYPNQSFSIKYGCHTLPHYPPVIAASKVYAESDLSSYNKRQKTFSYRIKTIFVESITWQWLYSWHLLVVYELILTTRITPLGSTYYSWLPAEVVVVVSWLLKSDWNLNAPLFKALELQESRSMLIQEEDHPFASIPMMYGSGDNPTQYPPSESSGQQVTKATTEPARSFTSLQYFVSGDDEGDSQQNSHTLGLNCFVHPCHGVCNFRISFDSTESVESQQNSLNSSYPYLADGHRLSCVDQNDLSDVQLPFDYDPVFDGNPGDEVAHTTDVAGSLIDDVALFETLPSKTEDFEVVNKSLDLRYLLEGDQILFTHDHSERQPTTTESSQLDQSQLHLSHEGAIPVTHNTRQFICDVTVVEENGLRRPCGKACKNARVLSNHKCGYHRGERICDVIVIGENGQQRQCGNVCNNANVLWEHRRKVHSGQQICNVTVVGEDGQPRPCRMVFKNVPSLSTHKTKYHTGQKNCAVTIIGENGRQRACGVVCKNAAALSHHKRREHSGQKICDSTVVGEDGQLRPCGKVCKNIQDLLGHRGKVHRLQQICDKFVFGEDGQLRPCGKVCKNAPALSLHKRRDHTGQKACDVIVFEGDGLSRQCGKICKSKEELHYHRRKHRKRKPVDLAQDNDISP